MRKRFLGISGLEVSVLAFGAMNFGKGSWPGVGGTMLEAARAQVGRGGCVGILATTGTLRTGLYQRAAEAAGLRTVTPLELRRPEGDGAELQQQLVMVPIFGGHSARHGSVVGIKSGGMPSDAAGPVADSVTPIVMSAIAACASIVKTAAVTAACNDRFFMGEVPPYSLYGGAILCATGLQRLTASRISRSSVTSSGGAGGAGGVSRFRRFICFTIRKMMNARIRKLIATVMKLP